VFRLSADGSAANILVGWSVDHAGLRTERDWRPVLASPSRWAEFHRFVRTGLAVGIDIGPARLGIKAFEYVLLYEGCAFDKIDPAVPPFQKPDVPIPRNINQTFNVSSVACVIDEDWR